jgi:hypothetical protein
MTEDIKYLSFSSPKGGVGRTLTLSNCAKIYAKGCGWAGISASVAILADLDFHAPGIHYYDFSKMGNRPAAYQIAGHVARLSHRNFLQSLKQQRTGLLFLLTDILNDGQYVRSMSAYAQELRNDKRPREEIYADITATIDRTLQQKQHDPMRHLVTVENGDSRIYVFPAASPNHEDYQLALFNFNWIAFNGVFGLLLLDGIFLSAAKAVSTRQNTAAPVRILVDQQAGVSIPSSLNRNLADASVVVSGLNWQNKDGLEGLIDNYWKTSNKKPWVVLNQYKYRKIALKNTLNLEDHDTTLHEEFRRIDEEERKIFVEEICHDRAGLREKVFVTEFIDDAVQKEHFYDDCELAMKTLVRMLVGIEREFRNETLSTATGGQQEPILFIGEKVQVGKTYSGPLNGVYQLLQKFFPETTIIALALRHEDIVALAQRKQLSGSLKFRDHVKEQADIRSQPSGIYDFVPEEGGPTVLNIAMVDLISYPHHVKSCLLSGHLIERFGTKDFIRSLPAPDALCGTSLAYFEENVLRWDEYAANADEQFDSIPLFVNFQLLAYRKQVVYDNPHFKKNYREQFHRNFEGLRQPQDLIDFASLTIGDDESTNNVLLCGNAGNIAMWYEWQSVLSIFYNDHGRLPECKSVAEYQRFLVSDAAMDATMLYLQLLDRANLTPVGEKNGKMEYDWDELIKRFFFKGSQSLIFVWPDAIPIRKGNHDPHADTRHSEEIIYQVPPSFHLFEECWDLSIVRKQRTQERTNALLSFLNYFLLPQSQEQYTHDGGLPVHKQVLSSLDIWSDYPFIPPIWSVYNDIKSRQLLTPRETFEKLYETGKIIADCLKEAFDNKYNRDALRDLFTEKLNRLIEYETYSH